MRILVADTRKRLMSIWFTGSGLVFALLLVQTILGKYGDQARDAWGVILPTFVPTLFLLIGILIAEAVGNANDSDVIVTSDRFFFRLMYVLPPSRSRRRSSPPARVPRLNDHVTTVSSAFARRIRPAKPAKAVVT